MKTALIIIFVVVLSACNTVETYYVSGPDRAELATATATYKELVSLPEPRGRIVASVYSFRDQTGQYRSYPSSSFSTAVTQGGAAMLAKALHDSNWFITLEREGLQNLLTERKIIRAAQRKPNAPSNNSDYLPSLVAANVLMEGGIIAYESNVQTGGVGARYLGIGGDQKYQVDQVTINLRLIDIRSGQVLNNVSTSKTILSTELQAGVFKFIEYQELLEAEIGVTVNEPAQLCVQAAIEAAVIHIIAQGVQRNQWQLKNPNDWPESTLATYLMQQYEHRQPVVDDHEPHIYKRK
ncbi:Curli production assembly/transport component CsgG [Sinobacterium norvegicum]|uniref:Curli production assembly/transport component CsgG n=1 Tax=Sinobacterium norvegicum TaxID=1641715 RepID=A0ABN8ENY7_9GAMM|nr:CsgG/HfaB family protein [Sinobacterium norvegicum]CAH0992677.1 Curli production assembly/transport component CsgG [Sinobacterium norvegicum]